MVITQHRAKRKPSGSVYQQSRRKRIFEKGNLPMLTKIAKTKKKTTKTRSLKSKTKLLSADTANLFDPKTKKYVKAKIEIVLENPANRHYARRNIITKGTIIKTDKGNAKVTSRPGQEGTVNAVLVEAKK